MNDARPVDATTQPATRRTDGSSQGVPDLRSFERAARDALADAHGHALSDEEWQAAKHALLELAKLLRDWTRPAGERAA